jgi:hypothetical protein
MAKMKAKCVVCGGNVEAVTDFCEMLDTYARLECENCGNLEPIDCKSCGQANVCGKYDIGV